MPDISRTIQIVFEAVDNTNEVFGRLVSGSQTLAGAIEDVTAPFADLTKGILAVEAGVLALGVAFAGAAVKESGEFGQAMTEIGTLFNAMPEDVERLKNEVLDFATSSTSTIPEITKAMYDAVSATGDWENATKFLADAEKLAVAGATDLGTSVDLLTTVMGAYGAETDEAARYSDALFNAVQVGKTTIEDMAGSIGRVAAAAAAGNVDIETLGAALAALTIAAGSTEQATTYLGALLKELSKPSEQLRAALGGLSLETDGLAPIMSRLATVTGGSQEKMNALFGSVEAANGALILARDASGKFAEALEKAKDIAGITAQAYEVMAREFDAVNQMLLNSVSVTLIQVGEKIKEGYAAIVLGIKSIFTELANAIGADNSAFDPILEYFNRKAAELGALFQQIANALPEALNGLDWSGLIASFEGLEDSIVKALTNIFGQIDITTPEGLRSAIQTIIDALANLNNATGGIIEGLEPLIKVLAEMFQAFLTMDPESIRAFGEALGSLTAINELAGMGQTALGVLEGLSTALTALTAVATIAGIRSLAGAIGAGGAAAAAGTLTGAFSALSTIAGPAIMAIATAWAAFEVGKYIQDTTGLGDAILRFIGVTDGASAPAERLGTSLERVSETTGMTITSMEGFNAAVKSGQIVFDEVTKTWVKASDASKTMADSTAVTTGNVQTLTTSVLNADGTISTYTRTVEQGASSVSRMGGAATSAEQDTESFRLSMARLATDERIKNMEFAMKLDIANVEANAKIAVAAFDSLGVTIQSTGDLLGRLYGLLTDDKMSDFEKSRIWEAIEKENEARYKALELQAELTEAYIEYMKARAEAMKEGAMVKIDGAGLQPHLEAFMWEILAAIQIKVNAEGLEMLVGA